MRVRERWLRAARLANVSPFQRKVWKAMSPGRCGLLIAADRRARCGWVAAPRLIVLLHVYVPPKLHEMGSQIFEVPRDPSKRRRVITDQQDAGSGRRCRCAHAWGLSVGATVAIVMIPSVTMTLRRPVSAYAERFVEGLDALPEKVTRQIAETLAHRASGKKSDLIKSSYGQQLP